MTVPRATLAAFLLTAFAAGFAHAQAESQPATVAAPRDTSLSGQLFKFRDPDGNLIHIPDLTLERWEEFRRFERNMIPDRPPAYSYIGPLSLQGQIDASHAEFEVQCSIRLNRAPPGSDLRDGWTRVGLRFNGAHIPSIAHTGDGEMTWSYDEAEGYVVWLKAAPGSEHRLEWTARLPVHQLARQQSLSFLLPSTSTVLQATLPGDDLQWSLGEADQRLVRTDKTDGDSTEIRAEGVGGAIQLKWQPRDETPPLLRAQAKLAIRLLGNQVESQAALVVRSLRGPIEEFFVRLPPETELLPTVQPELVVETLSSRESEPLGGGVIVRVGRLDGATDSQFEVELRTLRTLNTGAPADSEIEIETAGFEVLSAVSQSGEMEFDIEGDWTVEWEAGPYVRQVPIAKESSTARFRYYRQPYSLIARVGIPESRISVEPSYVLDADSQRVRLDATLNYRVRGARANAFRISMPGWVFEEVVPAEYVRRTTFESGELTVYLSTSTAVLGGQIELRLSAHRPYDADEPLVVPLPRVQAESSAPATLAVVSADNIRLAPRSEDLVGLVADFSAAGVNLPNRQHRPLIYRADTAAASPTFAADVEVLEQAVRVAVHSEVIVEESSVGVEQQFDYRIDYEPLRQLPFEIPEALAELGGWEVTEGEIDLAVNLTPAAAEDASVVRGGFRTLLADLREERIGNVRVVFRYQLPSESITGAEQTLVEIPLVQPSEQDVYVEENTLRLHAAVGFDVEMADENWELVADPPPRFAASGKSLYRVPGHVSRVAAVVDYAGQQRQSSTKLEKVWLQTWRVAGERRDRVCYQILSDEPFVELALPSNISKLRVAVDGEEQMVGWEPGQTLRVALTPAERGQRTIELWYFLPAEQGYWNEVETSLPRLVGVERANRIFWQLVVPAHEHLLWPSKSLTSESIWRWRGLSWRRVPQLNQNELETLLNTTPQPELPAGTNQYLYSSTGPLRVVTFFTIERAALATVFSAIALVVGLSALYFSWVRHPAVALVAGVATIGLASVFPEVTVMAVQAALLGCGLVLLARLLQWTVAARPSYRASYSSHSRAPSRAEISSPRIDVGSSKIPTTVTPMAYQVPTAESET